MKTFAILTVVALAMPVLPLALAHHHDNHGTNGTVPNMPNQSIFGLCTAWAANEKGRENGNAGNAGPFVWLQDQAEENDPSVEEFCANRAPGGPP